MPDTHDSVIHDLARQAFALPEKLGWEYREPVPPRPSPERDGEPLWYGPIPDAAPDHNAVEPGHAGPPGNNVARQAAHPVIERRRQGSRGKIVTVAVMFVVGLALVKFGGILLVLIAIVLAAIWFLPLLTKRQATGQKGDPAGEQRALEYARYQVAWQAWRQSVESWNAGEQARVDKASLWFPVTADPAVSRVDVFGGTIDGWAALATTLGASLLAGDRSVVLADLSEHDVSADLAAMARLHGIPVTVLDLPSEEGHTRVLAGLGSADLAEVIAGAVDTARGAESVELRALDARLIRYVTERLDGDHSFHRIGAGLRVLRRTYDSGATDQSLSDREVLSLTEAIDIAGQDDQTQRELQFLIDCMDLLTLNAAMAQGKEEDEGFWPHGALVIRTSDQNIRRKDLADRVLVQTLLSRLRQGEGRLPPGTGTLIIVGCDHIGLKTLENVAQMARRAGLKTVLIMEHLRGDLTQLLGGSDSASLIMRLGNAQEAAAAAEYIGRGHKFVMNQVSRQLSEGTTEGEAKQWGATGTVTDSRTYGGGHGPGGFHANWTSSSSVSRSDTWSRTVNWSTTSTVTDGATASRVYEFAVEPTQIQSMPATAFLFARTSGGKRQVVAGDCNPGISLLDRVDNLPAPDADPRGYPA